MACLVLLLAGSSAYAAQPDDFDTHPDVFKGRDDQAAAMIRIFQAACMKTDGGPTGVHVWADRWKLKPLPDNDVKDLLSAPGGKGWQLGRFETPYYVTITPQSECSVWAETADTVEVNEWFGKLMIGADGLEGLSADLYHDAPLETRDGPARLIIYRYDLPEGPVSALFLAQTWELESAPIKARLTRALVRKE